MKNLIKKAIMAALVAALVLAALPLASAFAQGENPPKRGELTAEQVEKIWAKQLQVYEKIGKNFENTDAQIAKIQSLIDKAKANGKDVTAIQTALDNFEAALKKANPTYQSVKGVVNSHQGFDANGKVTDLEKAKTTVQDMRAKMQELKTAMAGSGMALREALKAFREANKPADGATPQRDS